MASYGGGQRQDQGMYRASSSQQSTGSAYAQSYASSPRQPLWQQNTDSGGQLMRYDPSTNRESLSTPRGPTWSAGYSAYGQQFRASTYGPTVRQSVPRVTQHGSVITSIIELEAGATLDQGDKVIGVPRSGVEQRGSKIGGRIKGAKNSKIRQGDIVDDNSMRVPKQNASASQPAHSSRGHQSR